MTLLDKQGKPTAKVISQQLKDTTDTVYNFEVHEFSTYHSGEVGIWVHNANCCDFITGKNGTLVDIRSMSPQEIVGIQRELKVVDMIGGKLSKTVRKDSVIEDVFIYDKSGNKLVGIDAFGKNGEYIAIGGPAKGSTPKKLEGTLEKIRILKSEAAKNGKKAQAYYKQGNSDKFKKLIEESKKVLGDDNVIIFKP